MREKMRVCGIRKINYNIKLNKKNIIKKKCTSKQAAIVSKLVQSLTVATEQTTSFFF